MGRKEGRRKREELRRRRAERWQREDERLRRLDLLLKAVAGAVVILVGIGAAIAVSQSLKGSSGEAAEVRERYAGIPQRGIVLGDAKAKLTITEYADLQCPACRRFAREELPKLLEVVRSGEAKLEVRPFPILGVDSQTAAVASLIAARERRYFEFLDLFYRNQGPENTGYVTDAFLNQLLEQAGVRRKFEPERGLERRVERLAREGERRGVRGTPTLFVSGPGGVVQATDATAEAVLEALEWVRQKPPADAPGPTSSSV